MPVEKLTLTKLGEGIGQVLADCRKFLGAIGPARRSGGFTYVDVGAAGGFPRPIALACRAGLIRVIAVDATEVAPIGSRMTCVRTAVSADGGPMTLFETRHPGCSSLRRPNAAVLARWPVRSYFDVISQIELQTQSLGAVLAAQSIEGPILLKMDVQGIEGDLVSSLGPVLESVLAIEVEAQFFELYEGQMTFFDVYTFLRSAGFYLKAIHKQGRFEGDLVEANCFFARDAGTERHRAVLDFWWKINGLGRKLRWDDLSADAIERVRRKWL